MKSVGLRKKSSHNFKRGHNIWVCLSLNPKDSLPYYATSKEELREQVKVKKSWYPNNFVKVWTCEIKYFDIV